MKTMNDLIRSLEDEQPVAAYWLERYHAALLQITECDRLIVAIKIALKSLPGAETDITEEAISP